MIMFPKNYSIKRKAAGTFTKGIFTEGTETTITIVADVQPITGKDFEALNIGREYRGAVRIYTDVTLNFSAASQTPDKIVFDSFDYEILELNKRDGGLITHNKYIAYLR